MGGSKPSAPTTVLPRPTPPPAVYQSIVPEEDYKRVAERVKAIEAETAIALARRNEMVGSPADIGQRMAERNAITAAAYQSSLPTGEGSTKYDAVKEAASNALEIARQRAGFGVSTTPAPGSAPTPQPVSPRHQEREQRRAQKNAERALRLAQRNAERSAKLNEAKGDGSSNTSPTV